MTKLSFIVPVYNVVPYLRKCVYSLVHQDFSDYEIVLIDDGSTDESGKICDELSESIRDERLAIRVIHQKNGGLSAARNAGLKVAKGEYVCFVDSDDYWEENVLGGLMEQIGRDNLDVLRFKYQNVRIVNSEDIIVNSRVEDVKYEVFNPNKLDPYRNDDYSNEPTDGVSFLNSRFGTACYAVMFIIKRCLIYKDGMRKQNESLALNEPLRSMSRTDVLNDGISKQNEPLSLNDICLFTEGIYFEDTDWTPRMLCKASRVASTDTIVYNYLVRQGSITKAIDESKKKKVLDDKIRLIQSLQQQSKTLRKSGRYNSWYHVMIAATTVSIVGMLSRDFYGEFERDIKLLKELRVFPIMEISMKARLINISPVMMVKLLHLKNRY